MAEFKAATTVVYHPVREEFLLVKRADTKDRNPGLWEFPGGVVEADETPEKAGMRELKEETGLTGEVLRTGEPGIIESDLGGIEIHPFLVLVENDSVELSREHKEYRWLGLKGIEDFETVKGIEKELEAVGIGK